MPLSRTEGSTYLLDNELPHDRRGPILSGPEASQGGKPRSLLDNAVDVLACELGVNPCIVDIPNGELTVQE